ncbi:MAG: SDR family oxidoreductase [Desulfobacterales bacterium]|nr:SDR family oxidoreductase [Desulfobacterales bacterium]
MEINFNSEHVVVVTGGTRGIGLALVKDILDSGASVAVISRKSTGLLDTVFCDCDSKRLFLYDCDIGNYHDVEKTFHKIENDAGMISGLINNAGVNPSRNTIINTNLEDWEQTISVNLSGTFYCSKFAIQSMKKCGKGVIITISSIAGITAMEKRASYSASKAGVIGLMRSIAADYSSKKIRAYCICPAYIETSLTKPYLESLDEQEYNILLGKHRLGSLGETSDISNLALFLLSEYSKWLTGVVIPVDGGYSV